MDKPIAILTDDFQKAFRDKMLELKDSIVDYSLNKREIKTKDDRYIFCTSEDHLRGWIIKGFRTMKYHPTSRNSQRDMAAMLIIAPMRVR